MEQVIAEYEDLNTAEHAVRSLEHHGLSIQNVSISDESHRVWRKSRPAWVRRSRGQMARRWFGSGAALGFVVAQFGLRASFMPAEPLSAALTWALVCGTCVLAGCLGAALTLTRPATERHKSPGFYVILRSDAGTIEAARSYLASERQREEGSPA